MFVCPLILTLMSLSHCSSPGVWFVSTWFCRVQLPAGIEHRPHPVPAAALETVLLPSVPPEEGFSYIYICSIYLQTCDTLTPNAVVHFRSLGKSQFFQHFQNPLFLNSCATGLTVNSPVDKKCNHLSGSLQDSMSKHSSVDTEGNQNLNVKSWWLRIGCSSYCADMWTGLLMHEQNG